VRRHCTEKCTTGIRTAAIMPSQTALLIGFLIFSLNDSLVYFRTTDELVTDVEPDPGNRIRLGGQVVPSTQSVTDDGVDFAITNGDPNNEVIINVSHRGAPAQLFQEGIGIVVEGVWDGERFHSNTMIVKHDGQYRTKDGEIYVPGEYPAGNSP